MLKRVPRVYWAMDLNPDQLLAMGKLKRGSLLHRVLESVNRFVLRHATLTVALDRFMDERLHLDGRKPGGEVLVMPPWSHEEVVEPLPHAENWFREKHGMAGKFVVMYSGNHSPSNPLDTLLEAARQLKDDERIRFAFIGGGMSKPALDAFVAGHHLHNVISLPYQPLADLRYSLSAADVHVVSLGEGMVGIIHPCKVYGAMAVGRPILFFGPRPSHVFDLLDAHRIGTHVSHGDVDGAVEAIRRLREMATAQRRDMGQTAQQVLRATLAQSLLCGRLCDAMERALGLESTLPKLTPGQRSDDENADRADAGRLRLSV